MKDDHWIWAYGNRINLLRDKVIFTVFFILWMILAVIIVYHFSAHIPPRA